MDQLTFDATRPLSVGLDYHQDTTQVCILNSARAMLCNDSVRGSRSDSIVRLIRKYGTRARIAVEACSGSATLADELIGMTGWDVQQCHPGYVSRMRQNKDKSDYSDARVLAELIHCGYLPRVWLASPEIRDLRQLVRYRQQRVSQKTTIKLRIRALLREARVPNVPKNLWSSDGRQWLKTLSALRPHAAWVMSEHVDDLYAVEARLDRVARRLVEVAEGDPQIQKLMQHKGIGLVTACVMRAEIGPFDRFHSGRQLSRFCGLSPCNASSGRRQADAGLIRGCSKLLRTVLIEAAHRLIRYDERWKDLASQMKQRGKAGSVVTAAVANRWIRKLYYELREALASPAVA